MSSWPPRAGSTGSTIAASTSTAATSRRSNSRLPTTLNARDQPPAEVSDQRVSGLTGAVHNAIDGRIVEIVAELDRDGLWGVTGARSVAGLVAWKMGCSSGNAHTIATVARRLPEFPRCARGMREGRLSLDQVG
ncbi:hypothetical protein B6F32_15165, partial [Mycobacterium tuberculosis variant bovis]